ncbi:hypothetical protein Lsha_1577 [Legionella shakespearei DSM 23087]|uniref:Uncharacterized protein n=1 Tax=Legionella shakespearei DSM 23087 TaxID=1122169 RepID=A0A0W0YVF7_9GAMM|nr:hypothetical protein Lsha_1577 [Legionella shakespearei DSM 23087]
MIMDYLMHGILRFSWIDKHCNENLDYVTLHRIHVVLSASFCAKDLQILAMCQFQEILRAKRRAQDDVDP